MGREQSSVGILQAGRPQSVDVGLRVGRCVPRYLFLAARIARFGYARGALTVDLKVIANTIPRPVPCAGRRV